MITDIASYLRFFDSAAATDGARYRRAAPHGGGLAPARGRR